ncbi:MAG: DUF4270 family protein [Alistipes sp.]
MKNYNKFRCAWSAFAVLLVTGILSFAGCTTSDDTLGSDFLPDNQEMTSGTLRLDKAKRYFETRLFQTDSIKASNIGSGYFGTSRNDTTGLVSAGFLSQFLSYYRVDSAYFGYRPIFDSAQIVLSITQKGRDTLTPQEFAVYEIINNDYLKRSDTVFYLNFDPTKYVSAEPLFTFTFPNGTSTGPSSKAVTMTPTAKGREFVNRLMISDGTKLYQEGVGYSTYTDGAKFVNTFKGLYVKPTHPETMVAGKGSVFGTTLSASGFSIFCRNRVESDPTLINDTIGALYYFYDTSVTDVGNKSVNIVHHDYAGSQINIAEAVETNTARPLNTNIIVTGMGGVVSELSFTQEFFDAIEEVLTKANDAAAAKGLPADYKTLAINRGLLTIYFTGGDYDWAKIDVPVVTPLMSAALPRMGSYTNFKKLVGIPDYDYYAEKNYNSTLDYGGYINRSQGCYRLDISGFVQQLWNSYKQEKTVVGREKVDLSKIKDRAIYLAPDAYNLFTTAFAKVQGMEGGTNTAPVKIDLTYTLIK